MLDMECCQLQFGSTWPQPHPPAKKTNFPKWLVIKTKKALTGCSPPHRAPSPVFRQRDLLLFHLPRSSQSMSYSETTKPPKIPKVLRWIRPSTTEITLSLRTLSYGRSLKNSGRATTRFSRNLRGSEQNVTRTRTRCSLLGGSQTRLLSPAIGP